MKLRVEQFIHEWNHGSHDLAREMARSYVDDNRMFLTNMLGQYGLPELVDLVTYYRTDGNEEARATVDMWLLSEFQPQNIVGRIGIGAVQMESVLQAVSDIANGRG